MTEKESRKKRDGLTLVVTGDGKGKTTSSLGTAFRALGWGWKVLIVQFIKNECATGERRLIDELKLPIEIHSMGCGFTWNSKDKSKDIKACEDALSFVCEKINSEEYDLIVMDEINIALSLNYLSTEKVINILKKRAPWLHIILTGRNAPDKLIEFADLVSEVKCIKHPFDSGRPAQKGIDF